jgi:hypothetical protein
MKLRNFTIFSLILLLSLFGSCSKKSDNKGVQLNLEISPDTVTDFLYAKMNYQFKFTDEFPGLDDEYRVFVHFWRIKTKEMLLQDDHTPETPISKWKNGGSLSYSRVVFIPQFLDEFDIDFEGYEEVKLTAGLYKPSEEDSKIILFQEVLNVQAASLNAPEKVYSEGWHQPETDLKIKNPEEQTWRWTAKRAVCIIENPRKEALLIIRGGVDKTIFTDQEVIFKINDNVLEKFIPASAKFSKKYTISPAMMGEEDEFKLIVETDKSFIPSEQFKDKGVKDDRELGVQVFFLYFRENIK